MLQFKPRRLFCGEILRRWPHLLADDVTNTNGEPEKLVALLRNTYEYSKERAEKELDLLASEFNDKMRRAA